MNQSGLAVPKERQVVTVHLGGGVKREGAVFLESARGGMTLHQKLVAFLDDEAAFFPLTLDDGSGTEFLQKKNVRMIELEYAADRERIEQAISIMFTVHVTAVFPDDTSLTGLLIEDVPPEKARLSDCLNLPHAFLCVRTAGTLWYVNKALLRRVEYAAIL